MSEKIILKGVIQSFDKMNRNNGRIYPTDYLKWLTKRFAPDRRIKSINKIFR